MNTRRTKKLVEDNGVVTLKADLTSSNAEIQELLHQLGNPTETLPYYAIFPAGKPTRPIVMKELITQSQVLDALKRAGPSARADAVVRGAADQGNSSDDTSATTRDAAPYALES